MKAIIKKNLLCFLVYFAGYIVFLLLGAFEIIPFFRELTFDQVAFVLALIALILNFVILKPMLNILSYKNRIVKCSVFSVLVLLFSNIWFWTSILLGMIIFFSSGGMP